MAIPTKTVLIREAALFLTLLFCGFILLPIGIYAVGREVFGDYGGYGYGDFFGTLSARVRSGELVAWFLILSPYLLWQGLRLTVLGWQLADKAKTTNRP